MNILRYLFPIFFQKEEILEIEDDFVLVEDHLKTMVILKTITEENEEELIMNKDINTKNYQKKKKNKKKLVKKS